MFEELVARGFAIRVPRAGEDETMKERIARVLCPVEDHNGPCEVPWGFTVADEADEADNLVVQLYSSPEKAAEMLERLKPVVGPPIKLAVGDPDISEHLATQYRIENERSS